MSPLFDANLLPKITLPDFLKARPLESEDFSKGFKECLGDLTDVTGLNAEIFAKQFEKMRNPPATYYIVVIEDIHNSKIVSSGSLVLEQKFIRGGGQAGHIEDIVVLKDYRGLNLGKVIIECLTHIGLEVNCYKIILDCAEKNVGFYEKCGYQRKEIQMVLYRSNKSKL